MNTASPSSIWLGPAERSAEQTRSEKRQLFMQLVVKGSDDASQKTAMYVHVQEFCTGTQTEIQSFTAASPDYKQLVQLKPECVQSLTVISPILQEFTVFTAT